MLFSLFYGIYMLVTELANIGIDWKRARLRTSGARVKDEPLDRLLILGHPNIDSTILRCIIIKVWSWEISICINFSLSLSIFREKLRLSYTDCFRYNTKCLITNLMYDFSTFKKFYKSLFLNKFCALLFVQTCSYFFKFNTALRYNNLIIILFNKLIFNLREEIFFP